MIIRESIFSLIGVSLFPKFLLSIVYSSVLFWFSVFGGEIESRLGAMGISASLMFPPVKVPIADIIDRIAREGCLYAIVVSSQNELHRSCTLNILLGAPQGKIAHSLHWVYSMFPCSIRLGLFHV